MADEKNLEDKKLTPGFGEAVAGITPAPETQTEELIPPAGPGTPRQQFSGAAQRPPRVKPDGRIAGKSGKTPHGVVTDTPQVSFGDAFVKFLHMLTLLLSGKREQFDREYGQSGGFKEKYVDPVERDDYSVRKITKPERETIRRMDETLRETRQDPGNVGKIILSNLGKLQHISPQISRLLDVITKPESGGSFNIIYDYTGSRGLKPGDTTRGGLVVPDITKLTVNQVIDWQKKYLDEQVAAGVSKRSTAAGGLQFIHTTLKEMRDKGLVNGNDIFNAETQYNAGVARMLQMRQLMDFVEGKISKETFLNQLKLEWEGTPNANRADLNQALDAIKQNYKPS